MQNTDLAHVIEEARKAQAGDSPGKTELMGESLGDEESGTELLSPAKLREAGWSYIWHVATGVPSLVNNNWLQWKLAHKDKEGNYVWQATKPANAPKRGTLKCMLHPDDPNRPVYDELGFPTCSKSNLINLYQQRRHAQKRHKAEWAAMKEMEVERKEAEKEKREIAMMEALAGGQKGDVIEVNGHPCTECDFVAKSEAGLYSHMRSHK